MPTILTILASRLPPAPKESPTDITADQRERFLSRILPPNANGCSLWAGRRNDDGGRLKINNKEVSAHRFAYLLHHGPIPPSHHVKHTCHNLLCMTPEHLYTSLPTVKDKPLKTPRKKLSPDDINTIRQLRVDGKKLGEIALMFHVTPPTIHNICKGYIHQNMSFLPQHQPKNLP